MKVLLSLVAVCCAVDICAATYAFPVRAENYAVELFQSINKNIAWDASNFLVDSAGPFAVCANADRRGALVTNKFTQDGASVGGLVDTISGSRTDAGAVTGYIQTMLRQWTVQSPFQNQVLAARLFGCSVRPGCRGDKVVVACLFTPNSAGNPDNIVKPTTTTTERPLDLKQYAVAFTPQQYRTAEVITNANWDSSHYLENLSGVETRCEMITSTNWSFDNAKAVAARNGMRINGLLGIRPNTGSTEAALRSILEQWAPQFDGPNLAKITNGGCSLIPDCRLNSQLFVVVSCLVEV